MTIRSDLFMDGELAAKYIEILPQIVETTDVDDPLDPLLYNVLYWLRNFFEIHGANNAKVFTNEFVLISKKILQDDYRDYVESNGYTTFGTFLSWWIRNDFENGSFPNFTVNIYSLMLNELKRILRML